jgi:hypothetical protein
MTSNIVKNKRKPCWFNCFCWFMTGSSTETNHNMNFKRFSSPISCGETVTGLKQKVKRTTSVWITLSAAFFPHSASSSEWIGGDCQSGWLSNVQVRKKFLHLVKSLLILTFSWCTWGSCKKSAGQTSLVVNQFLTFLQYFIDEDRYCDVRFTPYSRLSDVKINGRNGSDLTSNEFHIASQWLAQWMLI